MLGVVGPIAAFGLFFLGQRVFAVGRPQLQTMMYLMLSVAGHLTIFMSALPWGWVTFVWGYALIWALISDRIKLLAYRIFDPHSTAAVDVALQTFDGDGVTRSRG